jgi:acyl carrier protein
MLGETLNLGARAEKLQAHSELFGSLPELDSMALVMLVMDIEQRFGFMLDDEDVTAENFATLGSLTQLIDSKLS